MNALETVAIQCPYCWESFTINVDCSVASQEYVEDCEVCCQPIALTVSIDEEGFPQVTAQRES